MQLTVLGSGSKGNSSLIQTRNVHFLLDCGFSGKEIERRLSAIEIKPTDIAGIIVSHEHSDHIKGVGILARRYHLPIYINKKTYQLSKNSLKNVEMRFFETGDTILYEDLKIRTMSLSHDGADTVGFTFSENGQSNGHDQKIGYVTDLGIVTNEVRQSLQNIDALIFEANHDTEMLLNGPYPWQLKRRIQGRHGHLSNDQSAQLLAEIVSHTALKEVTLAHLSEQNNDPALARDHIQELIQHKTDQYIKVHIAPQDRPAETIVVE